MGKNSKKLVANLGKDEQAILESVERGEWKSVEDFEQEVDFAKKAAKNFLRTLRYGALHQS